ncbi:MAG TPA: hypothetical protein VNA31_04335 [bacterium]|nr:hypothetical protein [bacterium]
MIGVGDRLLLLLYVLTVTLAGVELWLLRGIKTARAARDKRQAWGWVLMMTILPVDVYHNRLTTAEVLVLIALAVVPGAGLYLSSLRRKRSGSDVDTT